MVNEEYKGIIRSTCYVAKVIGWAFMYALIVEHLIILNPEKMISNWAIGIMGIIAFSMLYITPADINIWFKYKRFYKFWILFWLAWFIADYQDFVERFAQLMGSI